MKFRSDFVTNSSSSSYISVTIESNTLSEMMLKFQKEMCPALFDEGVDIYELHFRDNTGLSHIRIDGNKVTYSEDESGYYDGPATLVEALNTFISIFDEDYSQIVKVDDTPILEEEYKNPTDIRSKIAEAIFLNSDKIFGDVQYVEFEQSDFGYGGDDDSRYDESNYSKRYLKKLYKTIAEAHEVSVDEVTDDMFADYVSERNSVATYLFTYDRKTGKCKVSEDYYLEDSYLED